MPVKNLLMPKTSKKCRSSLPRRVFWVVLALALLAAGTLPAAAAPPQSYESLRLITEALHEINQKYVWQKGEGEMMHGALRGMMNSLDPDSSFLTPKEYQEFQAGEKALPAEAGMELVFKDHLLTVVSVLDEGPAFRAGIRPGDHILKIDGQTMRNITTQEGVRRFQGKPGTVLKLQVLRNGLVKPLDLTLTLEPLGPGRITSQILKDSYAYLRVPFFTDETPGQLADAVKKLVHRQPPLRGLILDLRNNARGTMEQAVRSASVLLGDREIVSTRGRQGDGERSYRGKERELALKPPLPLVVLIDQGTARGAEIMAGALRYHSRGQLLGAKSFGLCGITNVLPLNDGSALMMTVAHCYTPGGQKITGKGLEPDVAGQKPEGEKPPTPSSRTLPPDQDPWVLQAVELLKTGKTALSVKSSPAP